MTTLKQEWDLVAQDQRRTLDAFIRLCKARYTMHTLRVRYNEAHNNERRVSRLQESVDEYGMSYEYCKAIDATRGAVWAAINAETSYKQSLDAWLDAA